MRSELFSQLFYSLFKIGKKCALVRNRLELPNIRVVCSNIFLYLLKLELSLQRDDLSRFYQNELS